MNRVLVAGVAMLCLAGLAGCGEQGAGPSGETADAASGGARMIGVTVEKVPDGGSGKDIAIELAKMAG